MRRVLRKIVPRRAIQWVRVRQYERGLPTRSVSPPQPGQPHSLPDELIVSLTSYPKRFDVLHLAIRSLLEQSVNPDRVILWVAIADRDALPRKVRILEQSGLEVRTAADTRSYKKLVDAVEQFPQAYIVTADDDIFYPPDWLATLVETVEPGKMEVLMHRAHRLPATQSELDSYPSWEWNVQDERSRQPSVDLLATGVGGILYPPGSLHPDVVKRAIFLDLCPQGDDLWFYWMARRAGSTYRKVGTAFDHDPLPGSQRESLFADNLGATYDQQIANLVARYGLPHRLDFRTAPSD